ncbi:hypothetical protein [Bacillus thuringiensis]|uniref:hypothetical protein n=1 Tax=Bacillus thuringiensis TaxID=1428 RepID=UPI000BF590DD|nr:hypothetical protein [Bacillus thuringiensis]PFC31714.1 hypothetical protein CN299_12230 [Bacillus thuringiensis]
MLKICEESITKYNITSQTLNLINNILDYDLSSITNNFNDNGIRNGRPFKCEQAYPIVRIFGRADFELAKRFEIEFKKFVILTLIKPDLRISPPGAVDMYWHFFILHSKKYFKFCKLVWNHNSDEIDYKHHNHYKDKFVHESVYEDTLILYQDIFGIPEPVTTLAGKKIPIWNVPGPYECYPGGEPGEDGDGDGDGDGD